MTCSARIVDDPDHAPLSLGRRRGRSRLGHHLVVAAARSISPRALLIVADAVTAETLRMALSAERFVVEAARTATEGLALAEANDYDQILLGAELPDMSAAEALRELRGAGLRAALFSVSTSVISPWEPPTLSIAAIRAG